MSKCYKAVDAQTKYFLSYTLPDYITLTYPLNQIVRPEIGQILVFQELECAEAYHRNIGRTLHYAILRCECGPLTKITWLLHSSLLSPQRVAKFWADPEAYSEDAHLVVVPLGTYATDWVKPIEVVRGFRWEKRL